MYRFDNGIKNTQGDVRQAAEFSWLVKNPERLEELEYLVAVGKLGVKLGAFKIKDYFVSPKSGLTAFQLVHGELLECTEFEKCRKLMEQDGMCAGRDDASTWNLQSPRYGII